MPSYLKRGWTAARAGESQTGAKAVLFGLCGALAVSAAIGLGATPLPQPVAAALFVVIVVAVACLLALQGLQAFLVMWVSTALLQNVAIGLWLHAGGTGDVVWTEAKTVAAGVLIVMGARSAMKSIASDRALSWTLAAYGVVLVAGLRSLEPEAIAYARNFGLPLALAVAVYGLRTTLDLAETARFLYRLAAVVVGFLALGNLLETVVGSERWRSLLNAESLDSVSALSQATPVLGVSVPRVGGFLLEPVTTGYLATGALIAAGVVLLTISKCGSFDPERRTWVTPLVQGFLSPWSVLVLGVVVIASSGTKSSVLALVVAAMVFVLSGLVGRSRAIYIVPASWALSIAAVVSYMSVVKPDVLKYGLSDPLRILGGDSTTYHWAGLVLGVRESVSPPWGHGLGAGGNFYYNFHPDEPKVHAEWLGTGSESGIGVLAHQLGILGLIVFLVAVVMLAHRWGAGSAVLLAAWTSGALFGESYFGPLVAWVYVVPAALLARNAGRHGEDLMLDRAALCLQRAKAIPRRVFSR